MSFLLKIDFLLLLLFHSNLNVSEHVAAVDCMVLLTLQLSLIHRMMVKVLAAVGQLIPPSRSLLEYQN